MTNSICGAGWKRHILLLATLGCSRPAAPLWEAAKQTEELLDLLAAKLGDELCRPYRGEARGCWALPPTAGSVPLNLNGYKPELVMLQCSALDSLMLYVYVYLKFLFV